MNIDDYLTVKLSAESTASHNSQTDSLHEIRQIYQYAKDIFGLGGLNKVKRPLSSIPTP